VSAVLRPAIQNRKPKIQNGVGCKLLAVVCRILTPAE
jgi:hypothetical protein